MFLRCSARKKDGKTHRYWSVVENRRLANGEAVQRHVLYLGEINDEQQISCRRGGGDFRRRRACCPLPILRMKGRNAGPSMDFSMQSDSTEAI